MGFIVLPARISGTSPITSITLRSCVGTTITRVTILAVIVLSLISFLGPVTQSGACLTSYDNNNDHCKVCEHTYGEFSRPNGRYWCHSK